MKEIGSFDDELAGFKRSCAHGSFEFNNSLQPFRNFVARHFHGVIRNDRHGVYIVRQKATGEVLYIGKSGTIDRNGVFKGQDISGRLVNVKNGDLPANEWFKTLLEEKGTLVIEYLFLHANPNSPTLVEAILLQAFYNERNSLPNRNNIF